MRLLLPITFALLASTSTGAVAAQGIGGLIKQKVTGRVDDATSKAVDKALDKAEAAVKCAVTDQQCIDTAKAAGKPVTVIDEKGAPLPEKTAALAAERQSAAQQPADPPGKGVWLNYDFVPGERPIFFEDFSADDVGDFPRRFKLVQGNFEVVEIRGKKYLRTTTGGRITVDLPEVLPDRFTVEVKYSAPGTTNGVTFNGGIDGWDSGQFGCAQTEAWVQAPDGGPWSGGPGDAAPADAFVDCRFTVDSRYIKAYHNTKRVGNNPMAGFTRGKTLRLELPGHDDGVLITDLRIAAGGKKLYDLLAADGRVATQGIFFDFGSDRLRGESTPTLKEIGDMLSQHPDLELTIEGHTDNVGAAAANLALSAKRATAVRQFLIDTYRVDAARLTAKGLGASNPATTNDTPEGRQANRRVELVKN